MTSNKRISKDQVPHDFPIPAGTEQETGFTRAETERVKGPVKTVFKSVAEKQRRRKK